MLSGRSRSFLSAQVSSATAETISLSRRESAEPHHYLGEVNSVAYRAGEGRAKRPDNVVPRFRSPRRCPSRQHLAGQRGSPEVKSVGHHVVGRCSSPWRSPSADGLPDQGRDDCCHVAGHGPRDAQALVQGSGRVDRGHAEPFLEISESEISDHCSEHCHRASGTEDGQDAMAPPSAGR
jgi:hypothetical protein